MLATPRGMADGMYDFRCTLEQQLSQQSLYLVHRFFHGKFLGILHKLSLRILAQLLDLTIVIAITFLLSTSISLSLLFRHTRSHYKYQSPLSARTPQC